MRSASVRELKEEANKLVLIYEVKRDSILESNFKINEYNLLEVKK